MAKPHSPDNGDTAHNCRDVKLDQAYIGSCTGGKITDMIFAANILKGNTVKIPTYVVPGSTEVHADMKRLNLRGAEKGPNEKSIEDVLRDAGCKVGASGCGACLGGPSDTFGRLQRSEVCISTTNRNFPGRMGSTKISGLSGVAADGGGQRADGVCDRSARIRERADRNGEPRGCCERLGDV